MSFLLFLFGYLSVLTLPGFALTLWLRVRFAPVISTVALSYICFTCLFLVAHYVGLSFHLFLASIAAILVASLAYLSIHRSRLRTALGHVIWPIAAITALSLVYQLTVGPYTEVPADVYAHLERFQSALRRVEQGSLGYSLSAKQLLMQGSGVYYYLLATVASPTQATGIDVVNVVDFVNRTLFIMAVFYFSRFIFSGRKHRNTIAAFACVFVTLHMGINVFAYLRYYSLAPGMLNFVIYLFATCAFLWSTSKRAFIPLLLSYTLLILAMISAAAIHLQEAMFIGVTVTLISVVILMSRLSSKRTTNPRASLGKLSWHPVVLLAIAITTFIALYITNYTTLERAPNAHWRLWEFGDGFSLVPSLYTLNLKLEFIQVITLWGVLVYFLFVLNVKRYRNNPFILAGMVLAPVFTFMNPFFVDLFLRHYNSTTLWRLSYLLPIHYVAADLASHYLSKIAQRGLYQKLVAGFALASLVLLLFSPLKLLKGMSYNRLSSLFPNTTGVDHHHYADLINFMNSLDGKRKVLTDPMSGYMLSGLSPHYSTRNKFFRGDRFTHFTFESYDDNPLDRHTGAVLIINLREKSRSRVGALSSHWPENEWVRVDRYYPPQLIEHLEQRTQTFKPLWQQNGITVYQIKP